MEGRKKYGKENSKDKSKKKKKKRETKIRKGVIYDVMFLQILRKVELIGTHVEIRSEHPGEKSTFTMGL
jgi:hypothetical protein